MSGRALSIRAGPSTAGELAIKRGWLELDESGTFVSSRKAARTSSPERRCQGFAPLLSSKLHKPAAGLASLPGLAPSDPR